VNAVSGALTIPAEIPSFRTNHEPWREIGNAHTNETAAPERTNPAKAKRNPPFFACFAQLRNYPRKIISQKL
jgi:hypothetical protein